MRGAVRRTTAMSHVAYVKATDVKIMSKSSNNRKNAEDETDTETDEIEGVHIIWCSVWQLS